MPKEIIKDEQYGMHVRFDSKDGKPSGETHLVTDAMLKITWGRDTYVQAAVVTDADPDGMQAQHISLNRSGCNDLIRVLRKARDQAYGSDA